MGDKFKVNVNYKKMIISTAILTLCSLVIMGIITFFVLFFAFPKTLGDISYDMGNYSLASSSYEKEYEKQGNIFYLYKAMNIRLKSENFEKYIEDYEVFTSAKDYDKFMAQITENNKKLNISILEKSATLNEYNYLRDRYIMSLIRCDKVQKAFDIAYSDFMKYDSFTFEKQGYYSMNRFIGRVDFAKYSELRDGYDKSLIDSMQDYLNESYSMFQSSKSSEDNLTRAYALALGNRLILVGQDIKTICTSLRIKEDIVAENIIKMQTINEDIKGILNI